MKKFFHEKAKKSTDQLKDLMLLIAVLISVGCSFLSTVALAEIWKSSYKTKLIDWEQERVPNLGCGRGHHHHHPQQQQCVCACGMPRCPLNCRRRRRRHGGRCQQCPQASIFTYNKFTRSALHKIALMLGEKGKTWWNLTLIVKWELVFSVWHIKLFNKSTRYAKMVNFF